MENTTETNLNSIVQMIRNQEILLPDFQRGFVWNVEKQKRLIASIIAKMPIGSILVLEGKKDDYGCRIIGRKEQPDLSRKAENELIYMLLDGQQRLTALTNIFSNLLYYDYEKTGSMMCDYKKIMSVDLLNRFFISIPSIETLGDKNDLFHLRDLDFILNNPETDIPSTFLSGDIMEHIVVKGFDEKTEEAYAPHTKNPTGIKKMCVTEEEYLIPLYLLVNDEGNNKNQNRLYEILKDIVNDVVAYRMEEEYDTLDDEGKKQFVKDNIDSDSWEVIEGSQYDRDIVVSEWEKEGYQEWADKMKRYLLSCISKLDLHQIVVKKSDRSRAIDIYENLNLGGITLSTFELVLAKAAKNKFDDNQNLYQQIASYIEEGKSYGDSQIITDSIRKSFTDFMERETSYSPSERMGVLDTKKNQLHSKYTEAFLDVLSLISNVPNYDKDAIDSSMIKREKILNLTADQICQNYKKACKGIDRACFFLQARCGIRNIQEVQYNLTLVLLGYILADDANYKNQMLMGKLEAWYWSAIFSGHYDKDQNTRVVQDIKDIIGSINGEGDAWIAEMKEKIFEMPGFSDKSTLLMKERILPKKVIRKTICQFYLTKNCKDLLKDIDINVFAEGADTLEEHHIVPIGTLKGKTYKKMEKEKREDKASLFNSPLNFALVLKKTNREISNNGLEYYIKQCNDSAVYEFNIETTGDELTQDNLSKFLEKRYGAIKTAVEARVKQYI